jgi:hypothetical protein
MGVLYLYAKSTKHLLEIFHWTWIVRIGSRPRPFVLTTVAAIAELKAMGRFQDMDVQIDEDEHSIEMHLPYLRKIFEG